jgi:dGTP triphosphohydrolase
VNAVLQDHNVEKQMSDSRGDVAYLMADISDVKEEEIRTLFQSLEGLSCKSSPSSSVLYRDMSGKIFADAEAKPASGQEYCTKPLSDSAHEHQGPLVKQIFRIFTFLHAHI